MSTHARPEVAFNTCIMLLKALQHSLEFEFNEQYGYVTASLAELGTAMDVALKMRVSRPPPTELIQSIQENDGVICEVADEDDTVLCLRNELKIGVTEVQTVLSVVSASLSVARVLSAGEETHS
jgi:protein-arginine kinase